MLWKHGLVWLTVCAIIAWAALTHPTATTHAAREAAMVEKWKQRPIVTSCEPRPGERIDLGRQEPIGPNAKPDAEPVQFIIRMQGCETFLAPAAKDRSSDER